MNSKNFAWVVLFSGLMSISSFAADHGTFASFKCSGPNLSTTYLNFFVDKKSGNEAELLVEVVFTGKKMNGAVIRSCNDNGILLRKKGSYSLDIDHQIAACADLTLQKSELGELIAKYGDAYPSRTGQYDTFKQRSLGMCIAINPSDSE